jgi:hypothetical protein
MLMVFKVQDPLSRALPSRDLEQKSPIISGNSVNTVTFTAGYLPLGVVALFLRNGGVDRSSFSTNLPEQEVKIRRARIIVYRRFIDCTVNYPLDNTGDTAKSNGLGARGTETT